MKYIWQIATAVLVVLLFSSVITCNRNKKAIPTNNDLALVDTVKHFINRIGTQTASINTLQLDKKQLIENVMNKDKQLAALVKEYSEIKSAVKYNTVTVLDSIPIVYKDSVPCVFKRFGDVKAPWYSFAWQATQKGIQIDSLTIPTTTIVLTGFKRKWFLGKQTLITDITNTNPYVKVTTIQSAEVNVPQPWYKKWHLWFVLGAVGGFIATQ